MRKTKKAAFYKVLDPKGEGKKETFPEDNCCYVIDGGYLLRRVRWPHEGTYDYLYEHYISYVHRHYGQHCYIVFDGYENLHRSTKAEEQNRRAREYQATEIDFTDNMLLTVKQDKFLKNAKNKVRLIKGLMNKMESVGTTKVAKGDADTLIVNTAIDLSKTKPNVVLVGTDVDLLLLLAQFSKSKNDIFLLKQGYDKVPTEIF